MKILRQVSLDRANRRKDKSVSLTFITSLEQTSDEFKEIDELIDQTGILYFKGMGELTTSELEELDSVDLEIEGKTKSQRLRNVLYRYWEKEYKEHTEFKNFYSLEMEKIIEHFKNKFND